MPKRIGFMPTEKLENMINEIMAENGYSTKAQVVTEAVVQLHRKTFPAWAPKARPQKGPPLTPQQRAQNKVASDEATKGARKEYAKVEKLNICDALEGVVENDVCKYYKYANGERFLQEVPVSRLTKDLINSQYSDKEREMKLRTMGKTSY